MLKLKKFIYGWGPVLLWMSLIFFFSSRPHVSVSDTYAINFIIFKALHMIEYAILFFLLFRALHRKNKRQALIQAVIIAVLYAISDEVHQTFIPTREGKLRDVFIDSLGIAIMYLYMKKPQNFFKKYV